MVRFHSQRTPARLSSPARSSKGVQEPPRKDAREASGYGGRGAGRPRVIARLCAAMQIISLLPAGKWQEPAHNRSRAGHRNLGQEVAIGAAMVVLHMIHVSAQIMFSEPKRRNPRRGPVGLTGCHQSGRGHAAKDERHKAEQAQQKMTHSPEHARQIHHGQTLTPACFPGGVAKRASAPHIPHTRPVLPPSSVCPGAQRGTAISRQECPRRGPCRPADRADAGSA